MFMVIGAFTVISSVYPSGLAFATAVEPIVPAAPARLSMTTGTPNSRSKTSRVRRATASVVAPGVNGTMTVIGRLG
jgi:hypothetical protein